MSLHNEVLIDPWSFLDYKESFHKPNQLGGWMMPSWVGDHKRRLTAYQVLEGYFRNAARNWLNTSVSDETRKARREYGDPFMIVEAVLSSVLGDVVTVEVDGVRQETEDLQGGAPDGEGDFVGPATLVQDIVDEWIDRERFRVKMNDNERTSIKLGDQVYVLGWNNKSKRPRLRTFDPGFYFPVLDDWENDTDWPKKVHIAWEYEKDVQGQKKKFLRRITWEMRPVEGRVATLPWNAEAHDETCWMYELEWEVSDDLRGTIEDLSSDRATWLIDETNLEIDFVPVVHIPNTVSETDHYGLSSYVHLMQIFDDLQATDTDLQAASATTGTPPLSVRGTMSRGDDKITSYGPGTVFESENGAELLDTSRALDALLKYKDGLQDRMSVNGRIPNTLIGRVDPEKVPSGIVLTLSFQPHSNMIRHMRLVREEKYNLLFKFIVRFFMLDGQIQTFFQPRIKFGSYLPADKQEVAMMVQQLLSTHGISLETASTMMLQAGFPIDDVAAEVARIQAQNFEGAQALAEASGDINAARAVLGLPPIPVNDLGNEDTGGDATTGGTPFELPTGESIPTPFQ